MDAPFLSPLSPPSLAPTTAVETLAADAQNPMRGADFANLLGHLMNPGGRQDLAAAGLQSVPIGPQIEVITVAEPLPDAASLLAFARGQGLDDTTLKALFGQTEGPSLAVTPSVAAGIDLSTKLDGSAGSTSLGPVVGVSASPAPEFPLLATAQVLEASRPMAMASAPLLAVDHQALTDASQPGAVLAPLRPAWSLPVPVPLQPLQIDSQAPSLAASQSLVSLPDRVVPSALASEIQSTSAEALKAANGDLPGVPAGLTLQAPVAPAALSEAVTTARVSALAAQGTSQAALVNANPATVQSPGSSPAALAVGAGAAGLVAPAGTVRDLRWQLSGPGGTAPTQASEAIEPQDAAPQPALLDVLRLRLAPQEAITRRLAALSGSGEQTAWVSVLGQTPAASLVRLDLRDPSLNLPAALDPGLGGAEPALTESDGPAPSGLTPVSAEAGRSNHASAASVSTAWTSTAAERAEQYEQLAQRLGEALGQRLQSQLERGQWKMQMRLDPVSLGRIDLELDMSAGGLDAVFRSDNPLTRDLIAQGLPRLKESLNQSGTAVANVWVQGDSSRQSGGNPTPWRAPESSGQAAGQEADSPEIVQTTVNRARQGTSAWDVLA